MTRSELTQKIILNKRRKKLSWASLAQTIGRSKVGSTAALLGQMPLSAEEAESVAKPLELEAGDVALLQVVPSRGAERAVPVDPTIYRFYD